MECNYEVMTIEDEHPPTLRDKKKLVISKCCAVLLAIIFIASIVGTGLIVYHFVPCLDDYLRPNVAIYNHHIPVVRQNKAIYFRLPKSVVPDLYEIRLMPFIWEGNFTFHGEVTIYINVTEATNNVTLHAANIKIDHKATTLKEVYPDYSIAKWLLIKEQTIDTAKQFYIIHSRQTLKAGKQYVVEFKFVGTLNDSLVGFYRSSYTVENQTRWIAATQFQPTFARQAFPCFDEPALKAKFEISIARPTNMTSLSNMPLMTSPEPVSEMPTYVWDHYHLSIPMSTYLVAFAITDFDVLKSQDNKFRVWTRPAAINQSQYSLNIGPRMLNYYEDYFQFKFPLPKIDMIALPDLLSHAMENWGLITYKESAMLFEDGISTIENHQRIAGILGHELVHQWFGNLVTPSWWTDLWLNEGFASYMSYVGLDIVEPEWKILEQFIVEMQNVFGLDALASSHKISIDVNNPDEIFELFDIISYSKAASIIRMMHHFLTTPVFKKGLTNFLNANAYSSTEQNHLWEALTNEAHKNHILPQNLTVTQIMDTWTLQTGFPVVTVMRNYNNGGAYLTQERFMLLNSTTVVTDDNPLWWIPITYTTEALKNFQQTEPSHWMAAESSLTLSNISAFSDQWVIFNIQETGYYRVNYDKTNWQLIIKQLKTANFKDISTINRGQLIDDALNLARAGRLDYATALDVTTYLAHESEYIPWKSALTAMSYLDNMLNKYQGYDQFRVYMLKLLDNVYSKVGFKDTPGDSQLTVFTRIDILIWACTLEHVDCLKNSLGQFRKWQKTPDPELDNPISPNMKSIVYCTAISNGGQAEWDFAWKRFKNTNVASEKDLLLQALGCSREPWILKRYLEWATAENSGIRKQDGFTVFTAISNNPVGQPLLISFLRNNWNHTKKYYEDSMFIISEAIKTVGTKINSKAELENLWEFVQEYSDDLRSIARGVQQSLEWADANLKWLDRNYLIIRDWLEPI